MDRYCCHKDSQLLTACLVASAHGDPLTTEHTQTLRPDPFPVVPAGSPRHRKLQRPAEDRAPLTEQRILNLFSFSLLF